MNHIALWRCDDGTYDIVDADGIVVTNVPGEALMYAKDAHEAFTRVCNQRDKVNSLLFDAKDALKLVVSAEDTGSALTLALAVDAARSSLSRIEEYLK